MDIPDRHQYRVIEPVNKGWSRDQKFYLETVQCEKRLIRFSPISLYEKKKEEFEVIQTMTSLGFQMSLPLALGITEDHRYVYMLLSWVEGEDLEKVLPSLAEEEQYRLGREAGLILKSIHRVPVPSHMLPVKTGYDKKMTQLKAYESSKHRIEHDAEAIRMIEDKMKRIWTRRPVFCHGDFHPGNLIYMKDCHLGVIDFNRYAVTDPYEAFYKLQSFARSISIPYSIGQIHAYFDDLVPDDFWDVVAVYVAHASLYSIKWAESYGEADILHMTALCKQAFEDYDDFTRVIPKWYRHPHQSIKEI